jgi:hydrogenase-4 component B
VFGMLFEIEEPRVSLDDPAPRYRLSLGDRAWGLIYVPIARAVEQASRRVVRLQSGNVRIYLGWTLGTLLVLLWIIS